jgi:hypothetical protein
MSKGIADGSGLMAFWATIDNDYLLRFQQWHNCEHIPERVAIPGFLRGRRYRDLAGEPFFLMLYETASPDTLASQPYLSALNNPTAWTKEALTHFRDPARSIYKLSADIGEPRSNPAPYLTAMRFNLNSDTANSSLELIAGEWLNSLTSISAIRRACLYEVDQAITAIITSERMIYGKGPEAQQFLILIEADLPHEVWNAKLAYSIKSTFRGEDPRVHLRSDSFWLEFGYSVPL